ncbi:glycosyltransferase family 2 protein [Kluyvera sichuanensis]|uniref:glycosyltransferase family 2 protein n=1 Tax=Kluyvera sichuanensis TaxID=2725494 RepID=UPI002FD15450
MLLSIVITLFNRKDLVCRSINSVAEIAQKEDVEVIIVDDGSTDNPLRVIESYIDGRNISYFYKDNGGAADAKNYGASVANGQYIIFLDSDDYLLNPDELLGFIKETRDSHYDFYYSKSVIIKKDDIQIEELSPAETIIAKNIYHYVLSFPLNYPGKPTYIFSRDAFLRSGGFSKHFKWGDAMLFWRIFLKNSVCCQIDFPSYIYDQSDNQSISRNHDENYYNNVYTTLSTTYNEIKEELAEKRYKMNWVLVLCLLALRRKDIYSFIKYLPLIIVNPIASLKSMSLILKNRSAKLK